MQTQAVLTDNGGCYLAPPWRAACAALDLRHLRTRPYRPQTNGKAERFIQTLLRDWAYARQYPSSRQRARTLGSWLRWYNRRRPHAALAGRPPYSRVPHLCGYDKCKHPDRLTRHSGAGRRAVCSMRIWRWLGSTPLWKLGW